MSRIDKLIETFTSKPAPKDFSWGDLVKLLKAFGYSEHEGSGSRKRFMNGSGQKILLHKRHPDSTLLGYQIEQVIEALKQEGHLK